MHTKVYAKAEDGRDYRIHHNGDWSGLVEIRLDDDEYVGEHVATLPLDLVIFIVGEMVRDFRISRAEQLDSRTLVTLPPKED